MNGRLVQLEGVGTNDAQDTVIESSIRRGEEFVLIRDISFQDSDLYRAGLEARIYPLTKAWQAHFDDLPFLIFLRGTLSHWFRRKVSL